VKRYGPLIAVRDALAVGDPGRHHLRLTPEAVVLRKGTESDGLFAWGDIERITLQVPTTRFRLPGFASTLLLSAVTVLTADTVDLDPDDGSAELVVEGTPTVVPLARHHVGGYWAPAVAGAHRLLAQLISTPEQRELLARPELLVDLAAKLARARPDAAG
jgi:hypothetical protein